MIKVAINGFGRIGRASHPDGAYIKMHVLGSEGSLVVNEASPEVAIHYREQPAKEARRQRVGSDLDFLLMEDFARAIDTDGDTILDARAGRAICATVQAAIDSGQSGAPVDVASVASAG